MMRLRETTAWQLSRRQVSFLTFAKRDIIQVPENEGCHAHNHHLYATIANLPAAGIKFDGCFSPYEQCQTLVGYISEHLGLPGNPASAYVKARSKHAAREALKAAGVPTPKVLTSRCLEEVSLLLAVLKGSVVESLWCLRQGGEVRKEAVERQ
jgi:biotin carboxylase